MYDISLKLILAGNVGGPGSRLYEASNGADED
jgi:hypothetical protein